ncbi:FHA domain-containing protein [Ammonicoccus fulvus]|uniref:FHA domain-containing protein n=1 Tax=Ammonicoccus fulvus TaxID=3138240 RepID=A0ABZ3FLR6_9ACTN
MNTPAVRIAPGTGIALRTAGIIAWFDPAPHEHPTLLVRNLIAAARDSGGLPQTHLVDLAHNTPGLDLAVVALGTEFGQAWVCGDAHITIDGVAERRVIAALGPGPQHAYFPLPRFAVRMGDATAPTAWSHLIEGAVPASGISVVWDPSEQIHVHGTPLGTAHGSAPDEAATDEAFVTFPITGSGSGADQPDDSRSAPAAEPTGRSPGVLVVDGRSAFTLDADYILGRSPHVGEGVDGVRVREVVLAKDRSISRVHAAIRVDDNGVHVEDLGSGIGTWVEAPGEAPIQLHPGRPFPLTGETIVFLGPHRVSYYPFVDRALG